MQGLTLIQALSLWWMPRLTCHSEGRWGQLRSRSCELGSTSRLEEEQPVEGEGQKQFRSEFVDTSKRLVFKSSTTTLCSLLLHYRIDESKGKINDQGKWRKEQ